MRSIEVAAHALCSADRRLENTRSEGKPMWESYVPQAVLDAFQIPHDLPAIRNSAISSGAVA